MVLRVTVFASFYAVTRPVRAKSESLRFRDYRDATEPAEEMVVVEKTNSTELASLTSKPTLGPF